MPLRDQADFGPQDFAGSGLEFAKAMAERGLEPPSADAMTRRRKPDEVLVLSGADHEDIVTVICISDARPWTHNTDPEHGGLKLGEQVGLPRKVAEAMEVRRQVRIVR